MTGLEVLPQLLVNGLIIGGTYALLGVGTVVVLRILSRVPVSEVEHAA